MRKYVGLTLLFFLFCFVQFSPKVKATNDLILDVPLQSIGNVVDNAGFLSIGETYLDNSSDDPTGPGSHGIGFSGDDYIYFNDANKNASFSGADKSFKVEAYVKSANFVKDQTLEVVSKVNSDASGLSWVLGIDYQGGIYCSINIDNTSVESSNFDPPVLIPAGVWSKIGCTYNSSSGKLTAWLNGVEVASATADEGFRILDDSAGTVSINGDPFYNFASFNDSIAGVKIYNYIPKPTITRQSGTGAVVTGQTSYNFHLNAYSSDVAVTGAEYQIESGAWHGCSADDGTFDAVATNEAVTCPITGLTRETSNNVHFRASSAGGINSDNLDIVFDLRSPEMIGQWTFDNLVDFATPIGDTPIINVGGSSANGVVELGDESNGGHAIVDGFAGKAIHFWGDVVWNPSRIRTEDPNGIYSFDGTNKKFYVEAQVFKTAFTDYVAGRFGRIVSKASTLLSDVWDTWSISTDPSQGISCLVTVWNTAHDGYESNTVNTSEGVDGGGTKLIDNQWNKVGCSWNGITGELSALINGTIVKTQTFAQKEIINSDGPLMFNNIYSKAANGWNGSGFNGKIDEIKIFNLTYQDLFVSSLTLTDKSIYKTTTGNFNFTGVAKGSDSITDVKWRKYLEGQAADANWSLCSAVDGTFDSRSENFSCLAPTTGVDGTYYFEIKAEDSNLENIDHVFPIGMLDTAGKLDSWFNFVNNTNGGQTSGNSKHFGTVSVIGNPTVVSGRYGDGAVHFDGNTYFMMADTTPLMDYAGNSGKFTIKARVKPTSVTGGNRTIMFKGRTYDETESYWFLNLDGDGKPYLNFLVGPTSFSPISFTSSHVMSSDNWNDIVVSFNVPNKTVCITVDSFEPECMNPGVDGNFWTINEDVLPSTGNLYVGANISNFRGFDAFDGLIDDIAVFNDKVNLPRVSQGTPWVTDTNQDSIDIHVIGFYASGALAGVEYKLGSGQWTLCTANDGTFDAAGANENTTCSIAGLANGVNNIKFRATGEDTTVTAIENYLSLDLIKASPGVTVTNAHIYLTSAGDFVYTGNAQGINSVVDVKWRTAIPGQAADAGWSDCRADDDNFDEPNEDYSCVIPTTEVDGSYNFEIKTDDSREDNIDHKFVEGLLDTNKKVEAWFDFSNIDTSGKHNGDSRSFTDVVKNGNPLLTDGKYSEGAVNFDNSTFYEMSDADSLLDYNGTDGKFSVTASVKPETVTGTNRTIVFKGDSTSYWRVSIGSDGKANSTLSIGTYPITITSTNLVAADAWNDIRVDWDVANRVSCIKLNSGTPVCEAWRHPQPVLTSSGNLVLGRSLGGPWEIDNFIGEIDELIIKRDSDATPPVITISPQAEADRVTTATPTFNLTFGDANGGVASAKYSINGGNFTTIDTPTDGTWGGTSETVSITLPHLNDGSYTMVVRSTDLLGHESLTSDVYTTPFFEASYAFKIEATDTTAPRIYSNSIMPNPGIDRKPAIRGYVKDYLQPNTGDTISNIANILYSLDGASFTGIPPLDGAYDSSNEDFYFQIPSELPLGDHTVQIRAIDAAGNSTSVNQVGATYGDVLLNFSVTTPVGTPSKETIIKNITFENHDLHDSIFSDAVWGNGIIRLRQKIDFADTIDYGADDHDTFGYTYGDNSMSVFPSTDGNLWIAGADGGITYYNTTSKTATKYSYSILKGDGTQISKIFEFVNNDNRYLMVSYSNNLSTIIYDIKNTPENVADDTTAFVDYANKAGIPEGYKTFLPSAVDTTSGTMAIYGTIADYSRGENVLRIDLKDTPMDISDDTFTAWGHAQGLGDNESGTFDGGFTGFYFDQAEHLFIGFHYDWGMYVCNVKDTPSDTSDDVCTTPWDGGTMVSKYVFSVTKDANGMYWTGGDVGLHRFDLNRTDTRSDDTSVLVWGWTALSGDSVSQIKWIPGIYPVGDEVWMMTRQGRIRGIEYNSTYDDSLDDTTYKFKIPQFDFRAGGASSFLLTDRNTIWVPVPGRGLDKVSLNRSYEDLNTIEIYPTPPDDLLEVDHVLLSDVVGSVSAGSIHTFSDLVTYEVSNDAGVTWKPAYVGDNLDFTTSDYKLKLKISLHKGSTPIMQSLSLSYIAQPQGTILAESNSQNTNTITSTNSVQNNLVPACGSTVTKGKPNLYQIKTTDKSATLYFKPPEGLYSSFYIVYSRDSKIWEYGTEFAQAVTNGVISHTINELKPNTKYYFDIRAGNGCATGEWGNVMFAKTTGSADKSRTTNKNSIDTVLENIKDVFSDLKEPLADDSINKIEAKTTTTPKPTSGSLLKRATDETTQSVSATIGNWWWILALIFILLIIFLWWYFKNRAYKRHD